MAFTQDETRSKPDLNKIRLGRLPLILMYHGIEEVSEDPYDLCVTPARFSEQMTWLAAHGLRGVSMETLVTAMQAGRERGLVGITFDDGYVNVLENAVPELLRHGFTATMFVVSDMLGGTNEWDKEPEWPLMSARQVKEMAAAGMEIGSHGATHVRLAGLDGDRLAAEISESRERLGELLGYPIRGFAYPYGIMDARARRAVRDAGYDYACAVETTMADLGIMALPRIMTYQRDSAARMAVREFFFKGNTATKGTRQRLSRIPLARHAKRRLVGLARR
jgi:peptidoglycan/xylan/chitin deacetylase (PgdA/CDA1 family)